MLDLSLDDDDLLDLPGVTPPPSQLWTPPVDLQLERCTAFLADVDAGRVQDCEYLGTLPERQKWTYVECFDYWYEKWQDTKNKLFLELAFLASAKCRARATVMTAVSPKLHNAHIQGEVFDCLPTLVRLMLRIPFDGPVRSNVKGMAGYRAVWFNRQTKQPVLPTEPFRLL